MNSIDTATFVQPILPNPYNDEEFRKAQAKKVLESSYGSIPPKEYREIVEFCGTEIKKLQQIAQNDVLRKERERLHPILGRIYNFSVDYFSSKKYLYPIAFLSIVVVYRIMKTLPIKPYQ
jgi:hypothetical protein